MVSKNTARTTTLIWHGDEVMEAIIATAKDAVDEVLDEAVIAAEARVPVRTGLLKSEIVVFEQAEDKGAFVEGTWGVDMDAYYGITVEINTPYLRPAMDQVTPHLGDWMEEYLPGHVKRLVPQDKPGARSNI